MEIKFGTGGFRGVIGDDFTKDTVTIIAQALSNIINEQNFKKEIVLGYDYRFLSNETSVWMSEVFSGNNIKVHLLNSASPSPTVMHLTEKFDLDLGVMITASHNPYKFNGVKVFTKGGYDADVEFTNLVEHEITKVTNIKSIDFKKAAKEKIVTEFDGVTPYVENIIRFTNAKIDKDLRIAFDNLNGVSYIAFKQIIDHYKLENVLTLNSKRDALFNGKMPNPIESNLDTLKKIVVEDKYDIGFATDSDGDRLGLIDEKGNYVSSNEILAALYYYLVKYHHEKGDIVKNLATSNLIDMIANKLGFKCHEVDVGFKNITHTMAKYDCLIGGESSGGLTIRGYVHGKDSVFAITLFLAMMSEIKKPVSEIIKEVREFSEYKQFVIEDFISYKKENEGKILEFLNKNKPPFALEVKKMENYGRNYKYYFEDNQRILIRLSGTEPVFRIFSEMNDEKMAKEDILRLNKFVGNIENGI